MDDKLKGSEPDLNLCLKTPVDQEEPSRLYQIACLRKEPGIRGLNASLNGKRSVDVIYQSEERLLVSYVDSVAKNMMHSKMRTIWRVIEERWLLNYVDSAATNMMHSNYADNVESDVKNVDI
ncbi:hypothetical protein RND71_006371 [Anisodus tanguticus]|uniref:Uncharacterized protein n=1 Tax=Anisodus tanguticus TaxID=243964 RepID=A0AAE1STN3_9SOLA|nr:hypothetical protein RND71_006371 [Anisodus tanguticus]